MLVLTRNLLFTALSLLTNMLLTASMRAGPDTSLLSDFSDSLPAVVSSRLKNSSTIVCAFVC